MSKNNFKKIVFVIVEGPSDETALGSPFVRIFDQSKVHVEIIWGDLTTEIQNNATNIVQKVAAKIKNYLNKNKPYIKKTDIEKIIHIVDTDGAYISDKNIVTDTNEKNFFYTTKEIRTNRPSDVKIRNQQKRSCLRTLIRRHEIMGIPYGIYYMSCCLDHVLFNKLNLSDIDKAKESRIFAINCRNNQLDFRDFISNSSFSVPGNFNETWTFIQKDLNSLNRNTNLALCFPEQE